MAAGDFNKPSGSSVRTGFMQEIRDLVKDVARMLNTDTATANIPIGAIRRNPTTHKFEVWSGTAWGDLDLSGQDVGKVDGYHASVTPAIDKIPVGGTSGKLANDVDTVDGYHGSQLAKLAEANTFTEPIIVEKAGANSISALYLSDTNHGTVVEKDAGGLNIDRLKFREYGGIFDFQCMTGGTPTTQFTIDQGKVTTGTVPLARMGSVVASGSTAMPANMSTDIPVDTSGANHQFYNYSIYGDGEVAYGSAVWANETVNSVGHSYLFRWTNQNTYLRLVNGSNTARTLYYKVYKLTET